MFWQHLKCSLTTTETWRTWKSSGIFFCFFLLSQLSEPGRLGTALFGPASRLASAKTSSSCDTSPTVECCSLSLCRTQSQEEEEWTWKCWRTFAVDELTVVRRDWLFFYAYAKRERTQRERWDKILRWRHSKIHCTHYDARRRETAWVLPETLEVRAGTWGSRQFQTQRASYRTDQTSLES